MPRQHCMCNNHKRKVKTIENKDWVDSGGPSAYTTPSTVRDHSQLRKRGGGVKPPITSGGMACGRRIF